MKKTSVAAALLTLAIPVVAHAQDAAPAPAAAAPPLPQQLVTSAPSAAAGPMVRVHVESPTPATLLHRAPGATAFERACETPCDTEVPLGDEYQMSGKGQKMNVFRISAQPGQTVIIECNPADDSAKTRGIVFAIVGGVGFNIAIIVDYIAVVAQALASSSDSNHDAANGITIAGVALTLITGALAIDGVVLLVGSSGSEPTQHVGALKSSYPLVARPADLHESVPWKRQEAAAAPPMMTIPIFTKTF